MMLMKNANFSKIPHLKPFLSLFSAVLLASFGLILSPNSSKVKNVIL
jgi:hypothetical protein